MDDPIHQRGWNETVRERLAQTRVFSCGRCAERSGGAAKNSDVSGAGHCGRLRHRDDARGAWESADVSGVRFWHLLSVAAAVHQRYPDKTIIIAGDDDYRLENNPGREKALAAAEAVAGAAIFPNFSAEQRAQGLTDFNDSGIQNPELVSRQLEEILQGVREQRLVGMQSIELARAV